MNELIQYLTTKYQKIGLSRKDLAEELSVSLSTIDRLIKMKVGIPKYKRIGNGIRARIVFPVHAVAEFLNENLVTTR